MGSGGRAGRRVGLLRNGFWVMVRHGMIYPKHQDLAVQAKTWRFWMVFPIQDRDWDRLGCTYSVESQATCDSDLAEIWMTQLDINVRLL